MNRIGVEILKAILYLALGFVGGRAAAQSPGSELAAAGRDAISLPAGQSRTTFWLTMYAVPPEDRDTLEGVVNDTLAKLSRTRTISRCARVTDTLLRVNVLDYAQTADEFKGWMAAKEKLGTTDYTFHVRTQIAPSSAVTITRTTNPLSVPDPKRVKTVTVEGGWTGLINAGNLRLLTGQFAPILRADTFVAQAIVAPAYYDFTGIPATETEFLKSVGVDPATIAKLRADVGANLLISQITQKERRVIEENGPLGGVYQTLDVAETTAEKSFLRRPVSADKFFAEYDAGEWFVMGPNGEFRVAVFDRQGKRQDAVADKIAKDDSDPHGPGIVQVGVSCFRCHVEGLRPFTDVQSRLLRGKVGIKSYDPGIVQRALEFYNAPRLLRQMKFDVETYTAAVNESCSLTVKEAADALGTVVRNHDYLPVTKAQACREIGVMPERFAALVENLQDPILYLLAEDEPVLRNQWASSFAVAALAAESTRGKR